VISILLNSNEFSWILVISFLIAFLFNVFVTLPIHECAHGFVAYKLGDNTAKYQGRLTLNPFAHIDYVGALSMLIVGFGWAKPVPVNAGYFKKPKVGMAITALAGPASNLILAFISLLLSNVVMLIGTAVGNETFLTVCWWIICTFWFIAEINTYLAIFNLIPIPPLDGSRILSAFLPDKYYYKLMQYERYTGLIVFALVYVFRDQLSIVSDFVLTGINILASLPFTGILY